MYKVKSKMRDTHSKVFPSDPNISPFLEAVAVPGPTSYQTCLPCLHDKVSVSPAKACLPFLSTTDHTWGQCLTSMHGGLTSSQSQFQIG